MLSLDIQVEIIKRIPVKSVIQFRTVCKAWKSFIDCSEFIASYSFRHTQSQHLVLRYQVGDLHEVKYISFVDDDSFPQQKFALTVPSLPSLVKVTRIIDSSHGLLCLAGYLGETDDSSTTQVAVIWNPAIRKSIVVVLPDVPHWRFKHIIVFGVCPDTKDAILVKITYIYNNWESESISCIPCQVMVFTLSSREWTCLCSSYLPRKSISFTWSQTVIGRFIYWVARDRTVVDGISRNMIMSFDMRTQEFTEVDLLVGLSESLFSVSRLRESLVVLEDLFWKSACVVWMMEDGDSKAFTKLFTINAPPNVLLWSTMGFRKSGEPIVEMENIKDCNQACALVVYEPCSEDIKDLGIRGHIFSFFATSYTESLLLLNHDDGHIVKCGAVKRLLLKQASSY